MSDDTGGTEVLPQNDVPPATTTRTVQAHYSGPLPPPVILREFDQIVPGGAERLIVLVEQDAAHERQIESTLVLGEFRERRRGQICALIIALFVVAVSAFVIVSGYEIVGGVYGRLAVG